MLKTLHHCLDWWPDAETHGPGSPKPNSLPGKVSLTAVIHCPAFSYQPFLRLIYDPWPRVMVLKANMTGQNLMNQTSVSHTTPLHFQILDEIALIGRPSFPTRVYSSAHCRLVSEPATTPTEEQDVNASY